MLESLLVKEALNEYYTSMGIIPGEHFACKFKDSCSGNLARGMQCHVGGSYGKKIKILVASLDCGNGGADVIDQRTKHIMSDAKQNTLNTHMRGTYQALSYFMDTTDKSELAEHMVMINTCKCCNIDSPNQLSYKYYRNCKDYKIEEISRIKPEVILFQGKSSLVGCEDKMRHIEDIDDADVYNYLRIYEDRGFTCYAVICIHPSARFKYYARRKTFYDKILPKIAMYIKDHALI